MLSLVPLGVFLAWFAVRREQARQEIEFGIEPGEPKELELNYANSGIFYVSTTFMASPLKKVWAHGLGNRGRAELVFTEPGLEIHRQGERGLLLPWSSTLVSLGQATIDRGTESNGLIQLRWSLGKTSLITSLRVVSANKQNEIMQGIKEHNSGDSI